MVTIEKLKAFGADTNEGLARCYNNETLYLKLINMLPKEKNFDRLQTAIQENDLDTAFEAAHALKGVIGNLSLTPMYKVIVEITEPLRSRTQMNYTPLVSELLRMKDEITAMCAD